MPGYSVYIAKDYTVFASGHFVTYDRDQTEPLHGHNYRASVSLEGELDENHYVFNFVPLKRLLRDACNQLDHRMLLPTGNPLIDVTTDGDDVLVRVGPKRYLFPRDDVVLLPIANTTAELLANWIAEQLEGPLLAAGAGNLRALEVGIEETFGQRAVCRREFPHG